MCLNIERPDKHHLPFGTKGKIVVLGVPILKHFRYSEQRTYSKQIRNTSTWPQQPIDLNSTVRHDDEVGQSSFAGRAIPGKVANIVLK